jgi:hypothetical protein
MSPILNRFYSVWKSNAFRLFLALAVGKAVVILPVYFLDPTTNAIHVMGAHWDSSYFEIIATRGYGPDAPLAFSPVYPALIRIANYALGNSWISALLVTNSLSFVFPILVCKSFDFKTALFAELFPTYLVFTTIAYSDVIALVFLAAAILLLMKGRAIGSSLALSGAILAFFNLAWTLPAFLFHFFREKSRRDLLAFFIAPLVTGVLILLWFKVQTGDLLAYFTLEAPWGVAFANPVAQAQYLLCPGGSGSFTCQSWEILGVALPPAYWLVRNLLFEAFYLVGALFLLKRGAVFLFVYCLLVFIPLLFLLGIPAMSIPRLLLPAFPVFLAYSTKLKRWGSVAYVVSCYSLTATISVIEYFAFFA